MTADSNLESVRRWYAKTSGEYEAGGLEAASDLLPEIFDPQVEFSPWLAREVEHRTYRGHDGLRTFFRELEDMLGRVRYAAPEFHPVSDEVIVVFTRLEGVGRGSDVPVGQDLGLVYEFRDGLVIQLTAFGSHDQALRAGEAAERAEAR
jgi:ketosteroid isomerase-like protein